MVDPTNASMPEVFDRIRQRIRSHSRVEYQSSESSAQSWQSQLVPDCLRQDLALCDKLRHAVGTLNPRNRGLHNRVIQLVKSLMRRSLTWYTRPLHEFHDALVRTLYGMGRSLQELECSSRAAAKHLDEVEGRSPIASEQRVTDSGLLDALRGQVAELSERLEVAEQNVRRLAGLLEQADPTVAANCGLASVPAVRGREPASAAASTARREPEDNDLVACKPDNDRQDRQDTRRNA
jgi:hypothetical protein